MNEIQQEALQNLVMLTDEQRLDARDRARAVVVRAHGEQPDRAQFMRTAVSQYPLWFMLLVAALLVVVFVAAAMPSLFRLFTAGREYFLHGIADSGQAAIVGFTTFVLAETLVILSTISARVFFVGRARRVFVLPVLMGLLVALVGNWHITRPADLFGWLETVVPPLAVLFIALIGERLVLDALETRHANERAYQEALKVWQISTANPESSSQWRAAYANAIRAKLVEVNGQGAGQKQRREIMSMMQASDWRPLVYREMQADQWYTEPENPTQGGQVLIAPPPVMMMSKNGNGAHSATV